MRLNLFLHPRGAEVVPFDHLPALVGAFHNWLGHANGLHDALSLYSLSWLSGARGTRGGLRFPNGARWTISAHDEGLIHQIVGGILKRKDLDHGLEVLDVQFQRPPVLPDGTHRFAVASPVFIKWQETGTTGAPDHILWDDARADAILTATFRRKLEQAGLLSEGAAVAFDRAYPKARTKLATYKGIHSRASLCPVLVTGTSAQLAFAWCVGVGHSTGIGFGSLV